MHLITTIITAYRRPHTIRPLVAALRAQTVKPDRIWAWANDPTPEVTTALAGAGLDRIVTSSENTYFHARFAMAMTAPSEFVAVFDDDSIPGPNWFANCLETMGRTPGILGTAGIVLHRPGYGDRTMYGWQRPNDETVEVDLVGQASFLRREWLPYLFVSSPVTGTNGEDIELGARLWRLAGIRSFCPPHPANDRSRWGSTRGMELGLDQAAASLANGEKHLRERDAIVKAEIAAGWVPLFGRSRQNPANQEEATSAGPAEVTVSTADRNSDERHRMIVAGKHHAYFDPKPRCLTVVYDADQPIVHDPRHSSVTVFELPRPRHLFLTENSDIEHELSGGPYETIDVGSLLATQRNPLDFLRQVRESLAPGGKLSAMFANVRHHATVGALLAGEWRPREIDPSATSAKPSTANHSTPNNPVRFYTRREVEKLLYRSGYTLIELAPEPCSDLERWRGVGSPGEVKVGPMHVAGLTHGDAEEFSVERYRVIAVGEERRGDAETGGRGDCAPRSALAVPRSELGLTSIIIVTYNALPFTQQCISSIRFLTDEDYEIICVDNGSTDGTIEYLRSCPAVKLIENAQNRGFPAAANQGVLASRGQFVLFLNNDVLVTTGWLTRMLGTLRADPKIGLVGPCSNCVSGPQQVEPGYHDLACLDGWAWEYGKQNDGRREEIDRLVGFCLLVRREVLDGVGLFDERFGIGNFEDDDLCRRAIAANWRAVIARDSYIHHFGHQSFAVAGTDLGSLLAHNQRLYEEKWRNAVNGPSSLVDGNGHAAPGVPRSGIRENSDANVAGTLPVPSSPAVTVGPVSDARVAEFARILEPAAGSTLRILASAATSSAAQSLTPNAKRLSCCMIARDNERTIVAAVESILPWVDEVIVLDTGSRDRTAEICRGLGCKVFHFPWPNSFSVARNESIKYATGEWIIWLDTDDVIDAENGRKLRELFSGPIPDNIFGFTMQVHCPPGQPESEHDAVVVDHCKVFRNRPDIRFEGRIHEQVLGSIRRAGGEIVYTPLFVVHAGADHTPEGRRRKLTRDFKLLRMELREQPGHTFTLFNLGMTFADAKKYCKAARVLKRSLAASEPGESHVRKIYSLLVSSLRELGRRDEAVRYCEEGLALFPKDAELQFRSGLLNHDAGRLRHAERAYLSALANDDELHFASLDRGITGYKARHNLAVVYADMGALQKAEEQWRRIVAEVPGYGQGWQGLVDTLLEQKRTIEAANVVGQILGGNSALRATAVMLAAKVAESQGDLSTARQILEQGVRCCPTESAPLEDLCRLLFYQAPPEETVTALNELVRRHPDNAAAHHNLGVVALRMGRAQDAVAAFQTSVHYRPQAAQTQLLLGYALRAAGRVDEALRAFDSCHRLSPSTSTGQEAQRQLESLGGLGKLLDVGRVA